MDGDDLPSPVNEDAIKSTSPNEPTKWITLRGNLGKKKGILVDHKKRRSRQKVGIKIKRN